MKEITLTEEEVNSLLAIVSDIPTKYGISIVTAIQKLWNEKAAEKSTEQEVDQK